MIRDVLSGEDRSPRRDVALLNAAAALALPDAGDDPIEAIREALDAAERALDTGAALEKLDTLAALSNALAAQSAQAERANDYRGNDRTSALRNSTGPRNAMSAPPRDLLTEIFAHKRVEVAKP